MTQPRNQSSWSLNRRALVLFATLGLIMAACATPRRRELSALTTEVAQLRKETAALKAQAKERERTMRDQAFALQAALRADLLALRAELQQAQAQEAENQGATGATEEQPEVASKVAAAPARPKATKRKREDATPAPKSAEGRSAEIRAMMAEVAALLQTASDSGARDETTRSRLQSAQRRLMEADRAAAKDDWDKAESLANEAAGMIADVSSSDAGP